MDAFRAAVGGLAEGQTLPFTVERDGQPVVVHVTMKAPRPDAPGQRPPTHPELRDELLQMREKDQAGRRQMVEGQLTQEQEQKVLDEMTQTDAANRERLKQIIERHGFPTISMVGEEAAGAVFLIVQHADRDPAFQKEMLPVLEEQAKKGEASKSSVAYLTDRIRRAENRPQLYATQYYQESSVDGGPPRYVAPVVEDPPNLDRRRRAMGLGPWRDYEAQMAQMQGREPFPAVRAPGE
jgi:hypothetical protein